MCQETTSSQSTHRRKVKCSTALCIGSRERSDNMARKATDLFSYAFGWLNRFTRSESQFRLPGQRGGEQSPLTFQEESRRRNMARGYKVQAAMKTRRYKRQKSYMGGKATRNDLRKKYNREISAIGLGKKRGDVIENPSQAVVMGERTRRAKK